jgi:hypothetical protein
LATDKSKGLASGGGPANPNDNATGLVDSGCTRLRVRQRCHGEQQLSWAEPRPT